MAKCFVGGVSHATTEEVMKGFFSQFGEVEEVVIVVDRDTRRPKGFGFVTFKDSEGAEKACAAPELSLDGRVLTVNPATKKGTKQTSTTSKKVFLGGLSANLTPEDLTESLTQFGEVDNVSVQRAGTGSKGYAFATFASVEIANKALESGSVDCKGTQITILVATERGQSPRGQMAPMRGQMRQRPVPGGYQGPMMHPMMHAGPYGYQPHPHMGGPMMGGFGGQQYMQNAPPAKRQRSFGKVIDRVNTSNDVAIPAKIFVGGISRDTTEEALTSFFAKFGEIDEVIVVKNRETRRPKGFGFIVYKDSEGAKNACAATDLTLDGRCLSVRPATKKGTKKTVTTSKQVFVGGLTENLSEAQVKMALSYFGEVEGVVIQRPASERTKGYAFATFASIDIANKAIEDGYVDCNGTRITILVSSSRSPNDPSSSRYSRASGPPPAQSGYYGGFAGQPRGMPPAQSGYYGGGYMGQQPRGMMPPAAGYGGVQGRSPVGQAPGHYAAPAPAAAEYMQVVSITVPAGCVPGQGIPVMSPTGEQMTVAIPAGVHPGQSFQMKMPAPAPVAPAAPEYTQIVSITVPAGCVPGQGIPIMTPSGEQMTVAIPAGCGPGQSFQMKIPAPAPAKLAPVMAVPVSGGYR